MEKTNIFDAPVPIPKPVKTYTTNEFSGIRYDNVNIIDLENITQTYDLNSHFSFWNLLINPMSIFTKKERPKTTIFDNFSYSIKDRADEGQFLCILGQSGCGKSTLLRYISGLQKPTSGQIKIYDELIKPEKSIPMVFQRYSSLPWFSVIKNVALPLLINKVDEKEAYERAKKMLKIVGLEGQENKYAKYPILSGGQLQRVAIARNLVANPQILLMDEPFGALDTVTRQDMQMFLRCVFETDNGVDPTIVLVTHDVREAVFLATDIIILDANPATVRHEMNIDLPHVRDLSLKRSSKYLEYVNEVEDVMKKIDPK